MSSPITNDTSDLWTLYQSFKTQLGGIVTEKVAILAAITTLRTGGQADFSSISLGGATGSESYSIIALQTRFDSLVKAEKDVLESTTSIRRLAISSEAGILSVRVPANGRCLQH